MRGVILVASATMNLWSIEHYMSASGNSIFDDLILPTGIDRDTLIDTILIKSEPYESLYHDGDYIKYFVGVWGRKWYRTFEKWVNALSLDYNPLHNYDRTEQWTESGNKSESENSQNTSTSSGNTSTNSTVNDTYGNDVTESTTTTNKVSAYNASTFQNDTQSQVDKTTNQDTTDLTSTNMSSNSTDSLVNSGKVDKATSDTNTRFGRAYGNIGTLTTQQMLMSELELQEWNLYEHIADIFLNEFVIPVF